MSAGTVLITDLIDADATSPRYCGFSIGRAIEIERGWLHVRRIERSGNRVYGVGDFVSPTQAARIQAKWDIRWGLMRAPNAPPPSLDKAPAGPTRLAKFDDVDSAAAAIVAAGYRELAKRHHPDAGGTHMAMSLLTQAKSQLQKILELAKGTV
jgi:hypothetical protein